MHALRRRSSLSASLAVALLAVLAGSALSGANASMAARVATGAAAQPEVPASGGLAQQPALRVLVTLREPPALRAPQLDIAVLRAQVASTQAGVLAALPVADFDLIYRYHAVPALAGRVSAAGLAALAQHPDVVEVTLDGQGTGALAQSVPLIHADDAHSAGVTGAGVVVAVLDSGIDTNHPDLAGDIAYEACFLSGGGCPGGAHPAEDDHGHGTNVAGIITSDGALAPTGVAPDARIAAYKVLNADDVGFFSDWTAALDDIIANHPEVDIVNMSLQSAADCPAGAMATAITTLRRQGVPAFISAGNHGTKNSFSIPACIIDGLSVGAAYDANIGTVNGWKSSCSDDTTSADQVACWSDSHDSLDLLAPGAAITSTGMGGGRSTFSGTSQAAPHATGVAALLLQAAPGLSVDQIEARLEATGTPLTDDLDDADPSTNRTTPRVDAQAALDGAGGGEPLFRRGTLDVAIEKPTTLAFGPDGRLYVASQTEIKALTLDPAAQQVLTIEQIASGLEDVMAIAFDRTAPPGSPVILYASRREPSATDGFDGTVSRFTAPTWAREDIITGLPSSRPFLNHLTNGLAFDDQGRLFIAQGSGTDTGLADPPGAKEYWPETALSAAILVADIHAPDFDGDITYDPPESPAGDSVDQVGGDVAVYAPGLRNPYDLVLHSNGYIYATDNGAMGPDASVSCTESESGVSVADELNLIEEGNYYGHPNRNRGRSDPRQCTYHAPEEGSGVGFTGPIAVLPDHCSCDGIAEYTGAAFGGAMLGNLIYAEHILGNISRAVLSQDGRSVLSIAVLASGLSQPLDVTVGPDGTIYIAEYGGNSISYLAPDSDRDGCADSRELGFDETLGGRRDPGNPWDFYDVTGDRVINVLDDIMPVASAFGPSTGPNYDPALDRSPPPSEAEEPDPTKREPWDLRPPDGVINALDDILGIAAQFGHSCA